LSIKSSRATSERPFVGVLPRGGNYEFYLYTLRFSQRS